MGNVNALAHLHEALRHTVAGAGSCLVVEGPAGIGKSRLLHAALEQARELGMAVAMSTATEIDRSAPLSSLLTALQSNADLQPAVADLVVAGNNPLLLVDRLRELIEDYVRDHTLVVCLDDAQWADELTALALRVLVTGMASSPVLWLLARRSSLSRATRRPAEEAIEWLITQGASCLRVSPLDDAAVAQLCARTLGATPDADVLAQAARSGGIPFLVQELMAALRDSGQITITGGVASLVTNQLPPTFLDAVERRLRDLSPTARRLLDAGAVLGRPFTVHEAAGLAGCSAIELIPAAEEAVHSGTLVDDGNQLAFRHDLIREAVYDRLPGPVRHALHREAALVAEAEGRSALQVSEHLIRGGRITDDKAASVLLGAVEQLAPTAPGTAADLIRRMLELLDSHHPERPHLVGKAVRLLACSGRIDEARQLGESALRAGLEPTCEAMLLLGLAEALKHAGYNAAVATYTRRALARPGVPQALRAQLLAVQAHGLLSSEELDEADRAGAEAARIGAVAGEHGAVVFGTVARSCVSRARGHLDEAVAYAREAVTVADHHGAEARQRHPRLWLARALMAADEFAEADAVFELGQRYAERLGTAWSHPLWHYYRAELHMAAGRTDDAEAEAEAGVRVAEQLNALALDVPLLALLGHIALRRDNRDLARERLRRAEQLVQEGVSVSPEVMGWRMALLHEADGDSAVAQRMLDGVFACLPGRLQLLLEEPSAAARLVVLAKRTGAYGNAERAAAAARILAERNPRNASFCAAALHADGMLNNDVRLLRAAVDKYRLSPRPLDRALALEHAGRAEDAVGHDREAVRLLGEAMEHFQRAGCARDAARVAAALRGRDPRRVGQRDSVEDGGWDSLTESEVRVVRLVAEGLTNRQVANRLYLSPHTVDSHLRHSFTKLGVSSRVELTRRVLRHLEQSRPDPVST